MTNAGTIPASESHPVERKSNTRRARACWDACAGLDTELLTHKFVGDIIASKMDLMARIEELNRKLFTTLAALGSAESFIAGFEGDDMQEGVDEMLLEIRTALDRPAFVFSTGAQENIAGTNATSGVSK